MLPRISQVVQYIQYILWYLFHFLRFSFARPHLFLLNTPHYFVPPYTPSCFSLHMLANRLARHPPVGFLTSPIAPPYIFLLHLRIFPRLLGAYD